MRTVYRLTITILSIFEVRLLQVMKIVGLWRGEEGKVIPRMRVQR